MSVHNRKAGIVEAFAIVLTSDNADDDIDQKFLDAIDKADPPIKGVGIGYPKPERNQHAIVFFTVDDEKAVREVLKRLEIPTVRA